MTAVNPGAVTNTTANVAGKLYAAWVDTSATALVGPAGQNVALGGGIAFSAGNNSQSTGTVYISNANGLTFGLDGLGNLTGSVASQTNQSVASGNIAGIGTTTTTQGGSTLGATLGSNGLSLAIPLWLTTAAAGGLAIAASNSTFTSGTVVMSAAGGALTISNAAQSVLFSVPAISSISGTGLVSISVNGSTISIGASPVQLSFFQPLGAIQNTTVTQNGLGSVQVYPAVSPYAFTATRADIMASVSAAVLALSTQAQTLSMYVGLYSLNGGTLSLASSGSQSYAWTNSSNNSNASITGMRRFSAPINVNYTGGFDLFVGIMTNTTFVNTNGISLSNVVVPLGPGPQLQGFIGQTQVNTMQFVPGQGFYSITSASMPVSMALSGILGAGSGGNAVDYYSPVQFVNVTA
jgi:hypothetical protein